MVFHEVRFPTAISRGATVAAERRTEIVVLGSGREERNARWADSRRRFNAGWGIKSLNDLYTVIAFFEERRGRLYGFRWRDPSDYKSSPPQTPITATDQLIGTGDATTATFQLVKTYGAGTTAYVRSIAKPEAGSITVAVDGITKTQDVDFTIDTTTGLVSFLPGAIPDVDQVITAGFNFDVPVRFDSDQLEINLSHFNAGEIPDIPVLEIRI